MYPTMELQLTEDDDVRQVKDDIRQVYQRAKCFLQEGDHIRALDLTEASISLHGNSKSCAILHWLQGTIFSKLARERENDFVKCAYLSSALESNFKCSLLFPGSLEFICSCANSLFDLAEQLGSKMYYEKAVNKAKLGLALENPEEMIEYGRDLPSGTQGILNHQERIKGLKKELEKLINIAEAMMHLITVETVADLGTSVNEHESNSRLTYELQERAEMKKSETQNAAAEGLRSFWVGICAKSKRDFMKVSIEKLKCYAAQLYGSDGKEALERGLLFAKTNRRWGLWKCSTCSKEFSGSAEGNEHLAKEHTSTYSLSSKDIIPHKVDEIWAKMISVADWEPVNTEFAVEMIKNRLAAVKEFVYVNGWSKDWPLARDEDRRKVLKGIHQTVKSLSEYTALSRSIRDWMIHYTTKQLGLPQCYLEDSGLARTPQCICFLELSPLKQIQWHLCSIWTDIIITDLVSKAVDGVWESSRVKERINFDSEFSCLLLDNRLLRGKVDAFDDEGTVDFCSNDHYAKVSPQGDKIITWLLDCPLMDEKFAFHRPIRLQNLDIWLAVLRIIDCRCRTLEKKCKKKLDLTAYDAALEEAKGLCIREDERRRNVPNDQWNTYSSILCSKCNELVLPDGWIPDATIPFLSAVRDILKGATSPGFGVFEMEDFLDIISRLHNPSDDFVLKSLDTLKTVVSYKIPLMDSKILVAERSKNQLLNDLTRLSFFDYRLLVLPLLKCFLREELEKMMEMDHKASSVASEASLYRDRTRKEEEISVDDEEKERKQNPQN